MNLADAKNAERLASNRETTVEADKGSGTIVQCLRQYAPSAVRRPQSPLNRVERDRFIVEIASEIGEATDTKILKLTFYRGLLTGLFLFAL